MPRVDLNDNKRQWIAAEPAAEQARLQESVAQLRGFDLDVLKNKLPQLEDEGTGTVEALQDAYRDGELTLMLGAGVSVPFNVPSWSELLQHLLVNTMKQEERVSTALTKLFTEIFSPNSLIAGRYLQEFYTDSSNHKLAFEKEVRELLYRDIKGNESSDLVREILQFCVAPGKSPNIDSIITYNYDDIIEHSLDKLSVDVPYKSIFGVGMNAENGEIPIYHVHGFLPRKGKLTEENRITLSESIYHQQYSDVYSWNNLVQLNKFRERTCLFIGISLTDPNMRRLLDIARLHQGSQKRFHYLFKRRYDVSYIEKALRDQLITNSDLLNTKSQASLDFHETAVFLKEIIERFEENDIHSFGVKCIWVDEFSEIPELMKQVRTLGRN